MASGHNNGEEKYREAPANIPAEQCLLGAILVNNGAYHKVSEMLRPEYFFDSIHAKIYEVASGMILAGKAVNPITIKNHLSDNIKIGDISISEYLARLATSAVSIVNARDYASAIYDLFCRRQLIDIGEEMVSIAYDSPLDASPQVQIDEASTRLFELSEANLTAAGQPSFSGSFLIESYLGMITKDPAKRSTQGVPIVLKEIQAVFAEERFEPENLYGLLAGSGEGKTSLTMQIIFHAISMGHPTCFFSYDQTGTQCVSQMVAQERGIESRHQRNHDMTERQFEDALSIAQRIGGMPFEVKPCDSKFDNCDRLTSRAKVFVRRFGNGKTPLFVFDHIGAIPPEYDDRNADPGTKARGVGNRIKGICKATKAAGLLLQQRNGDGMKRFNPRPTAADIFGGQGAMQPFDAIGYIFRAEEHMRKQIDTAKNSNEKDEIAARFASIFPSDVGIENIAEIGSLKVRFAKPGIKRYLRFIGQHTKYESLTNSVLEEEGLF